jgi:hypothetical protein
VAEAEEAVEEAAVIDDHLHQERLAERNTPETAYERYEEARCYKYTRQH